MAAEVPDAGVAIEANTGAKSNSRPALRRWTAWPYRIGLLLVGLMIVTQPITAGQTMAGTYDSLSFHSETAYWAWTGSFILLALGLLGFWGRTVTARTNGWLILLAIMITFQVFAGEDRDFTIHVPLGVAIVMLTVVVCWNELMTWRKP